MTLSAPYSSVVIGCGFMGSLFNETPSYDPRHTHAAGYDAHPATILSGVCDQNPIRAQTAAQHWNTKAFTDVEAMLAETKPVIISIASPTPTHSEILDIAFRTPSVKAVLCEKPITDTLESGMDAVRQAREKGIFLAVNYSRRYNKGHQAAHHAIQTGEIGRVRIVRAIYQNGILHNGTHLIDLLRFLIGDIVAVQAVPDDNVHEASSVTGILFFADGKAAQISGMDTDRVTFGEIDLVGDAGRIRTEQNGHVVWQYALEQSPLFPTFRTFGNPRNISPGLIENTFNAIDDLTACIEGRKAAPLCTGEDAIEAVKIAQAMLKSAQSGKRVEV